MPLAGSANRFFKVLVRGLHGNQPTLNVFHYRQAVPLQSSAEDVATAFRFGPLGALATVTNSAQSWQEIEVIDSLDVANFHTLPVTLAGLITAAEAVAPFITWSMRLLRSTRDVRSGWKRFSGINEADISGNVLQAAHYAAINAAAPNIAADLVDGVLTLAHCIVRDGPTLGTPTVDPNDSTTWYYTDVSGVFVPNRITTQNSRKFFS
jgi:hypothetical protein